MPVAKCLRPRELCGSLRQGPLRNAKFDFLSIVPMKAAMQAKTQIVCSPGDMPAAAYTPRSNFPTPCAPVDLGSQPQVNPLQTPKPPQTLASLPASLTTPSPRWPILAPSLGQARPTKLQTGLTKLQTSRQPARGVRWFHADGDTTAIAPRRISFGQSPNVTTPCTSALPLEAGAEGASTFTRTVLPSRHALAAQQQSDSVLDHSKCKRPRDTVEPSWSQQADKEVRLQLLPAEGSDRVVKRRKGSSRAPNEQSELPDAALAPPTRELRAMASVMGSRHRPCPGSCRGSAIEDDGKNKWENFGADHQTMIKMKTTIQQLQDELQVSSV